jgi:hypothetical protein
MLTVKTERRASLRLGMRINQSCIFLADTDDDDDNEGRKKVKVGQTK